MAASPTAADVGNINSQDRYRNSDDVPSDLAPVGSSELEPPQKVEDIEPVNAPAERSDEYRRSEPPVPGSKAAANYREKQVKPNKVYIGGLPEHTREEDLQNCFGKIGEIVNIELKLGYGFVEFDSREAAEESVAKYHEGFFMGNKIRVELSHGGGRTARYNGDPGACFKCGQMGHWARECPGGSGGAQSSVRKSHHHHSSHYPDPPVERRDYAPPPRDYTYREDYNRYPPSRGEPRYGFDLPPPQNREYRRPPSPPRDFRDYPSNVSRPPREYDDYRVRGPPTRAIYGSDAPPSYTPRGYDTPPERGADRRPPPTSDRYAAYPAPVPSSRPRTPPGPPPRLIRDEYERIPPRDYAPPAEYRGRPTTPPLPPPQSRYNEYPTRGEPQRYRRRSQSPPPRTSATNYRSGSYSEAIQDPPYSGGSSYPPAGGYSGNSYASGPSASSRNGGNVRDRDYVRNGPEAVYSRRA